MRVSPRLVDGAAEKCCDAALDTASHHVRSAVECPLAISAYTIGRPRLLWYDEVPSRISDRHGYKEIG
jgi:hypothetical protein